MEPSNNTPVTQNKTRILIVDDHKLIRLGLRLTLKTKQDQIELVGEADGVTGCIKLLDSGIVPDLVILDMKLIDGNGIEIARHLKEHHPEVKILVLSVDLSRETIYQIVKLGVNGFLNKNSTEEELLVAIESIIDGSDYFNQDFTKILKNLRDADNAIDEMLTKREQEIIKLSCEGKSSNQIAELMNISKRTVEQHKNNIFKKMGFNSTLEMITYAIENGIISIDRPR